MNEMNHNVRTSLILMFYLLNQHLGEVDPDLLQFVTLHVMYNDKYNTSKGLTSDVLYVYIES